MDSVTKLSSLEVLGRLIDKKPDVVMYALYINDLCPSDFGIKGSCGGELCGADEHRDCWNELIV